MNTPTLYLVSGISGSGKSSFTEIYKEALKAKEVNADNIRIRFGNVNDQNNNKKVFEIVDDEINKYLAGGFNVIVSNTNLHYSIYKKYSQKYPYNRIVGLLMRDSNDVELCKKRVKEDIEKGKNRSNVPMEVIDKQHMNFLNLLEDIKKDDKIQFFWVNGDFSIGEK